MTLSPDELRGWIDAWRSDEANERVYRWRRAQDAASPAAVTRKHARLNAPDVDEALSHLDGILPSTELAALAGHVARFRLEMALADGRESVERVGLAPVESNEIQATVLAAAEALFSENIDSRKRGAVIHAVEEKLGEPAREIRDSIAEGRERATALGLLAPSMRSHPDASAPREKLDGMARSILEASDGGYQEILDWLAAETLGRAPRDLWELGAMMRAPKVSAPFLAKGRAKRLGQFFSDSGLIDLLRSRVHVEEAHAEFDPRPRLAVTRAGQDVRIASASSPLELGASSEWFFLEAIARALAASTVSVSMPIEYQRPLLGSLARSMALACANCLADPAVLCRLWKYGSKEAELGARAVRAGVLFYIRFVAGTWSCSGMSNGDAQERMSYILRIRVPEAPVGGWISHAAGHAVRLRAVASSFAFAQSLRDQLDEDWYRNPRFKELFLDMSALGGARSAEAWLSDSGHSSDSWLDEVRGVGP